jgi:hypothetical protein
MSSPAPSKSDSQPPRRDLQFSLRTLLVVMTLIGLIAAAFLWNELAGIFTYLACLTLLVGIWRGRAAHANIKPAPGETGMEYAGRRDVAVMISGFASLAAAIAFCCTCTAAQLPFTSFMVTEDQAAAALARFRVGLFASIPIGTAAALFVYWLTWPKSDR